MSRFERNQYVAFTDAELKTRGTIIRLLQEAEENVENIVQSLRRLNKLVVYACLRTAGELASEACSGDQLSFDFATECERDEDSVPLTQAELFAAKVIEFQQAK